MRRYSRHIATHRGTVASGKWDQERSPTGHVQELRLLAAAVEGSLPPFIVENGKVVEESEVDFSSFYR